MGKRPIVSLKARHKMGFDCYCRQCQHEAKVTWEQGPEGETIVVIFCPKCKDNRIKL